MIKIEQMNLFHILGDRIGLDELGCFMCEVRLSVFKETLLEVFSIDAQFR